MRIFRLNYAADLKDLIADLREVIEWRTFGMHLNVPLVDMEHIQSDNRSDLRACREQMLITWAKVATPTWQAVVHSLIKTGYKRLAKDIAQKRGTFITFCVCLCRIDYIETCQLKDHLYPVATTLYIYKDHLVVFK